MIRCSISVLIHSRLGDISKLWNRPPQRAPRVDHGDGIYPRRMVIRNFLSETAMCMIVLNMMRSQPLYSIHSEIKI